jgi:2'-5' RNA ligase
MNKRLFIAIKYKPEKRIKDFITELKNEFADERFKWVDINNLHLTLKFLEIHLRIRSKGYLMH